MSGYITVELRRAVAARANHICEYCLIHERDTFVGCQVDHIMSEKHGGPTELDNLAFACVLCNRHKGSDLGSRDSATGELIRLFNPRTDFWGDHFQLVGGRIEWRTTIGEVTVSLLKMNDLRRVWEREALRGEGKYPSGAALLRLKRH
jgi:hypothetical protein